MGKTRLTKEKTHLKQQIASLERQCTILHHWIQYKPLYNKNIHNRKTRWGYLLLTRKTKVNLINKLPELINVERNLYKPVYDNFYSPSPSTL